VLPDQYLKSSDNLQIIASWVNGKDNGQRVHVELGQFELLTIFVNYKTWFLSVLTPGQTWSAENLLLFCRRRIDPWRTQNKQSWIILKDVNSNKYINLQTWLDHVTVNILMFLVYISRCLKARECKNYIKIKPKYLNC